MDGMDDKTDVGIKSRSCWNNDSVGCQSSGLHAKPTVQLRLKHSPKSLPVANSIIGHYKARDVKSALLEKKINFLF